MIFLSTFYYITRYLAIKQTNTLWNLETNKNLIDESFISDPIVLESPTQTKFSRGSSNRGIFFWGVGESDLGLFWGGDVCDFMAVWFCFILFSGNGKLAASIDSDSGIFIRLNRALSLAVKYYPVVSTKIINTKTKGLAVNFVNLLSQKKSWNLWIISG